MILITGANGVSRNPNILEREPACLENFIDKIVSERPSNDQVLELYQVFERKAE